MREDPDNVAAYVALDRLANIYVRGVDRRDPAIIKSVFHADAIEDHGTYFSGNAFDFADAIPEIMSAFSISQHCITSRIFEIEGDYAEGELYLFSATISHEKPAELYKVGGRYLDRYEKREGEWKVAHRRLVWDWTAVCAVGTGELAVERLGTTGRTDRCDASFEHFAFIGRTD